MRRLFLFPLTAILVLACAGLASLPARADGHPVVVELFTSQGCSSCPPADKTLRALAERADVIALSLHVNYWDYLGWRDTFAQPPFAQRQASYRDTWGQRVVYTPQIVVHGRKGSHGSRLGEIEGEIARAAAGSPPARMSIRGRNGMLKCLIEPVGAPSAAVVWMVKYRLSSTVEIARGENAGQTFTYANVVTSLNRIGDWSGTAPEEVALPQPGNGEGVAIWLQEGETGPIIAAAKIENR